MPPDGCERCNCWTTVAGSGQYVLDTEVSKVVWVCEDCIGPDDQSIPWPWNRQ